MKIPVTLLKAAIERHNTRAFATRTALVAKAYEKHLKELGADPLNKEAAKLAEKVADLSKRVKAAGLHLEGLSANADDDKVACTLGWNAKNDWERECADKLQETNPDCRETTVQTVLLAAAAAGTDDVAEFLDGLKLNWRN